MGTWSLQFCGVTLPGLLHISERMGSLRLLSYSTEELPLIHVCAEKKTVSQYEEPSFN